MVTQTQQVVQAYQAGDLKRAYQLIRGFRTLNRAEKALYSRAYEYLTHNSFYIQITTQYQRQQLLQEATQSLAVWVKGAQR